LECDAIPMAAYADDRDLRISVVERHESVDLSFHGVAEERLHAAEVAKAFLSNIRDECDCAGRPDSGLVQPATDRDEHLQAAAVVADSWTLQHLTASRDLDVGLFGENCVEVCSNHQMRVGSAARSIADDVAGAINADILEPKRNELAPEHVSPRRFF